jgi:branched-chain amino acid transport system substrate-binding protein
MRYRVYLCLPILLVALALPSQTNCEESKRIKVGVILPLTGNVAPFGEDVRDSLIFANKKLAKGKFEFIFEDDQCRGKDAVTAASKLLSIDRVSYGIIVCTESMLSAAPVFKNHRTIVITPIASGAAVSQIGDYSFRTWPSDAGAAKVLYDYVNKRHKRLGMISESRSNSQEFSTEFRKRASPDLKITEVNYLSEESDFRSTLLKLRSANIDGLFVNAAAPPPFLQILKQINQLRWAVPIYGAYFPADKNFLEQAGQMAEGIIFVDAPTIENILTPEGVSLLTTYTKEFGIPKSIPLIFASTFEVVRLLSLVSEHPSDSREYLRKNTFDGIFGRYSFNNNGDIVGLGHVLRVIDHGHAVPLGVRP